MVVRAMVRPPHRDRMTAATCLWLTLHLGSIHADSSYIDSNVGAGLSCDTSENTRIVAGSYANSVGNGTFYAGGHYLPFGERIKFGVTGVAVTGYPQTKVLAGLSAEIPVGKHMRVGISGILGCLVHAILQVKLP